MPLDGSWLYAIRMPWEALTVMLPRKPCRVHLDQCEEAEFDSGIDGVHLRTPMRCLEPRCYPSITLLWFPWGMVCLQGYVHSSWGIHCLTSKNPHATRRSES